MMIIIGITQRCRELGLEGSSSLSSIRVKAQIDTLNQSSDEQGILEDTDTFASPPNK